MTQFLHNLYLFVTTGIYGPLMQAWRYANDITI